ncbi:MAG: cupin domain-containing protein [Actinobacteria bacterium]|nr:cupin domain-containing protein [Actinomycetota bacterium]
MKVKLVFEDDIPGLDLPGRTSKVLIGPETVSSKNLSFGITTVKPKTTMQPHTHDIQEEIIYIIEGEGEVITKTSREKIHPGIAIYISSGIEHTIANNSDQTMKFSFSFSPPVKLGSYNNK